MEVAVEPIPEGGGRTAEHLAGRRAGTRAALALGAAAGPEGPAGTIPIWPTGVVGSISHAEAWAAAVTASTSDWQALGLDVDADGALPADDALVMLHPDEQRVLHAADDVSAADRVATLLWVAKEAAFKAWDAWSGGRLWGVDPARLRVDTSDDGRVAAWPTPDLDVDVVGVPPLIGRWGHAGRLVAVVLAAPSRGSESGSWAGPR